SLQVAPQLFGLMIAPCTWTLATTASTLDSRKKRTWRKAGQIPHAAMQPGQAACSKAPSPRSGAAGRVVGVVDPSLPSSAVATIGNDQTNERRTPRDTTRSH